MVRKPCEEQSTIEYSERFSECSNIDNVNSIYTLLTEQCLVLENFLIFMRNGLTEIRNPDDRLTFSKRQASSQWTTQ